MSMVTRLLPKEEWPRLVGTELETAWPHLPADAQVIVVEDDDRIVGTWGVFRAEHVECVWVHPAYRRRVSVARRLIVAMKSLVQARGSSAAMTAALTPEVVQILETLGAVELPGRHFVWSVR